MKNEKKSVFDLRVNEANPRTITDRKFSLLVDSILSMPEMLEVRSIVHDDGVVLGGNMRLRALLSIAGMDEAELAQRIRQCKDIHASETERETIIDKWIAWRDKPVVVTANVSDWTDDKKRQFLIKDNASFGAWDYDILANDWDSDELNRWGADVWNTDAQTLPEQEQKEDEFKAPAETQYLVEVVCKDETEQGDVYSKLDEQGYEVRFKIK